VSILRKESVTSVNSVDVRDLSRTDNPVDAKITLVRRGFADANGFIRHLDMHRVNVGFRVNGDRPDIQLLASANDANRDFSAVGNEDFLKHAE
jgi:hypothetical protein